MLPKPKHQYLVDLQKLMHEYFDGDDLEQICFELNVRGEDIQGRELTGRFRHLIMKLEQMGQLEELVAICREHRPKVQWPTPPLISPAEQPLSEWQKKVTGLLLKHLAPVLARLAFAKTLKGVTKPEEATLSLTALGSFRERIEAITGDYETAVHGQRVFDQVGEIAAKQLLDLFEETGNDWEPVRLQAVMTGIATALEKNGLRLLMDTAYNATQFIKAIVDIPLKDLGFDEHILTRRVLSDSARLLFAITEKLPHLAQENATHLLRNESHILQEVREAVAALRRMEQVSKQNNPEQEVAANFERDYRRLLTFDLDKLKLFGIPQIDNYHQPLTTAFVHLNAVKWQLAADRKREGLGFKQDDGRFFDREEQMQGSAMALMINATRMVIVGPAGAGKTTLLKWIAVRTAKQDDETPEPWRGRVPFYVRVRDYADKPFPTHKELPTQFGQTRDLQGEVPKGWVDEQLRSGRGIILLDGLDEVRAERRAGAFNWLQGLLARYPNAIYVVSTRPATLEDEATRRWLAELGFVQFRLRPLELSQMRQFIQQWHKALADEACSLPKAEKQGLALLAQKLERMVMAQKPLQDLASNPLLCAMLCALHHRYKQELPQNRVRLYQLCLGTLLDGRDAERGVDMGDYALARPFIPFIQLYLGRVAYWMMRHDQSVIGRDELWRQLELPSEGAAATQLVRYLVERSALLQEQAKDEFDFAHRSFQEYLAAERLVHDGDTTAESFHERAKEERWRDTLRLVAGLGNEQDKQRLLQALTQGDPRTTWSKHFALECYEWMAAPSKALQEMMQRYVATLVEDKKLNLSGADIGNLSFLPSLTQLQGLYLSETAVTDAGLVEVAKLTQLQGLYLSGTAVTDAGLVEVAKLRQLQLLDLSQTAVMDAGLVEVAKLTKLQWLYLAQTAVTDAGLVEVAKLTQLEWLDLGQTAVTDAGLVEVAKLTQLQALGLGQTAVTDAGLVEVAKLTKLQELDLGETAVTDAGLVEVTKLTQLQALGLGQTAVTDAGLVEVAKLTKLQELDLSQTAMTDAGLVEVAKLAKLQVLYLNQTAVTDAGLVEVAKLTQLQWLHLNQTAVTDAGLVEVAKLTQLGWLYLSETAVTDAGLVEVAKLSKLRLLDLGQTAVTDAGLVEVAKLTQLGWLYLSQTAVTHSAVERFKQNHPRKIEVFL